MIFMIKFTIYFSISFIILCIPIQNKTLFNLMHHHTKPYTTQIFSNVEQAASEQIKNGSSFTKKFFSNSDPGDHQDKVINKFSSTKKIAIENVDELMKDDVQDEEYTVEERELLNKILKEAR